MDKSSPHVELETLVGALIAQLHANGTLSGNDIEAIARRLVLSGMPEMADDVRAVPMVDLLSGPEATRYAFGVIDGGRDGGNEGS